MSKQSEAKEKQGYKNKADPNYCSNCKHYESEDQKYLDRHDQEYIKETYLRCGIGEFKVMRQSICNLHERKL